MQKSVIPKRYEKFDFLLSAVFYLWKCGWKLSPSRRSLLPVPGFKRSALSHCLPLHVHSTITSTKAPLTPSHGSTSAATTTPSPSGREEKHNAWEKGKEKTTVPFLSSLLKDPGPFKASLKEALLLIPSAMVGGFHSLLQKLLRPTKYQKK